MCLVFNQENLMLWLAAWREKSAPPHRPKKQGAKYPSSRQTTAQQKGGWQHLAHLVKSAAESSS